MAFWIAAGGIGLAVAALLAAALLRGRAGAEPAAAYDLRIYRDQLHEVERDLARGVIAATEAERLRAEVSRRVIDADRALRAGIAVDAAPRAATLAVAGLVAVAVLGAVWGYVRLGAPGYPDMPIRARIAMADEVYRTRPRQAAAEAAAPPVAAPRADADFLALMDRLRAALKDRPDDAKGHELLARNEAALGDFKAAEAAQARLVAIRGADVTAAERAALAEMMILAAGGYVSPEAEAELTRALELDPLNGTATYYAGLMFAQVGRPDRSFALWAPLLERSGPTDPWVVPLRDQIVRVAAEAGQDRYMLPSAETAPGPDAADMEAAAGMTPEARQEMIRGMVARLSDRLAREGGPAADWAKLISAYGVLGETAAAKAIWAEAQTRFAASPDDLAAVRAAAVTAKVAP